MVHRRGGAEMSGVTASFARGGSLRLLVLDITNTASPNIPNLLSAAGWRGIRQPVIIENSALVNTLVIPNTLAGANITILNKTGARIGGVISGGTALRTQIPIKVDNHGTISGGGGLGGNGQTAIVSWPPLGSVPSGGFTAPGGSKGSGQGFSSSQTLTISAAQSGGVTTLISGVVSGHSAWYDVKGGNGGSGGSWGNSGGPGGVASATVGGGATVSYTSAGSGGLAGYHTDGNSLVTWINTGTRLGRVRA